MDYIVFVKKFLRNNDCKILLVSLRVYIYLKMFVEKVLGRY